MNALSYFLTASLYLLLFYSCYRLILRRNTFFTLNRVYLLTAVVLSVVLPLIELPTRPQTTVPTLLLPTLTIGARGNGAVANLLPEPGFWFMYGVGVVVMLIRLARNGWAVAMLIGRGTTEQRSGYILVRLPDDGSASFSFGQYLVLNRTDALAPPDALLRHEEAHIRQHHTADRLFIELVRAAFWFNPVLWLYKQALQEVHEFLADRAASQASDTPDFRSDYARQLVAYALNAPTTALITPFVSSSTLKQRIVMLQKPQSNRRALLGYALVLPLAGLLTLCTQPDRDGVETETLSANQPARQAGIDGEVYTIVENQPEFPGGMKELGTYFEKNLHYPATAEKANVQGRVFLSFIVTKEGDIADIKILKGIGFGADEEAIRAVKAMPRWKPGLQSGQPVNVRFNLPINFQLEATKQVDKPSAQSTDVP